METEEMRAREWTTPKSTTSFRAATSSTSTSTVSDTHGSGFVLNTFECTTSLKTTTLKSQSRCEVHHPVLSSPANQELVSCLAPLNHNSCGSIANREKCLDPLCLTPTPCRKEACHMVLHEDLLPVH